MARPLRIEFPGALYHVTSRGNARQTIFNDDEDRETFLATLADAIARHRWICHSYCLMGNHYHLLVETPVPNLSKGMRLLNGVYTQAFNRRHKRAGHLFQGRFKAIKSSPTLFRISCDVWLVVFTWRLEIPLCLARFSVLVLSITPAQALCGPV
jgi:REP element-mobilizing transposase RayT